MAVLWSDEQLLRGHFERVLAQYEPSDREYSAAVAGLAMLATHGTGCRSAITEDDLLDQVQKILNDAEPYEAGEVHMVLHIDLANLERAYEKSAAKSPLPYKSVWAAFFLYVLAGVGLARMVEHATNLYVVLFP